MRDGIILFPRYRCTAFVHSGHRKRSPVESLGKIWVLYLSSISLWHLCTVFLARMCI